MKFRSEVHDMRAAAQLLEVLAAPLDQPVYLEVGRAGGKSICLQPALADTLREFCAYVARGESVTVMTYGPQKGGVGDDLSGMLLLEDPIK